jgi:hypothetical protein
MNKSGAFLAYLALQPHQGGKNESQCQLLELKPALAGQIKEALHSAARPLSNVEPSMLALSCALRELVDAMQSEHGSVWLRSRRLGWRPSARRI